MLTSISFICFLFSAWREESSSAEYRKGHPSQKEVSWRSKITNYFHPIVWHMFCPVILYYIKGQASSSIYADWVNGGWFYKPNSKSLGKFG